MKDPLLSLSASAGSGKTYRLVLRYLELLFLGENPSNILTLTFTKKAAKEMEEKIEKTLFLMSIGKCDSNIINYIESNYNIKVKDTISNIYQRYLEADTKIMTIDSFFQRILKNFCWYIGVMHDFEIKREDIEKIKLIMLENFESSYVNFDLLEFCYNEKISINEIVTICIFLDFYKESLSEDLFLKTQIQDIDNLKKEAMIYARNIQESYMSYKGKLCKALEFKDYDEMLNKGKTWLLKDFLNDYRDFSKVVFNSNDFVCLKDKIKEVFLNKESKYLRDIYTIFQVFLDSKLRYYRATNTLSFGGVASSVYELLLKQKIDKEFLYFRLDCNINHILIDEFQDTSLLQYEILEPLINEIKSGIGTKKFLRSFFYVGDVKQSIYRFRGGKPEIFDFASSRMKKEKLSDNYRSTNEVVSFVNDVFCNVLPNFTPQNAISNEAGYVCVRKCEDIKLGVYKSICTLLENGALESDIAILVFDNKSVVSLESFLKEKGLKLVIDTSERLISHNEVRALIESLKYLYFNNDIYLRAFYSLLGLEYSLDEFNNIDITKEPSNIIYKIMSKFEIGSLSAKRFLEYSLSFDTLDEILDDVESLDSEIVSSDLVGIRIMTIHKSKGLEFPHTIIMDKEGNKGVNTDKLLLSSKDGINIDRIYKKSKSTINNIRISLDSDYKNAIDNELKMELNDLKNQLYVAFTRAKRSMHIMLDKEKEDKDIGISILKLDEREIGDYKLCIQNSSTTKLQDEKRVILPNNKRILHDLGRQIDMQTIEKVDEDITNFNLESTLYGVAFHYCMEQKINNNIQDSILFEILKNQYGIYLKDSVINEIIESCNLSLKNEKFNEILHKGVVKCEIPFLSNGKQKRLDLLVIGDNEAFIVDYKSGAMNPKHIEQVQEYKHYVGEMLNYKIYGYIFYTKGNGKLVEVI